MINVDLGTVVLLAILSAALHWLIARATITKPLWSRARGVLDKLLRCPACSGFWIGLWLGVVGFRPVTSSVPVADVMAAGFLAMWLTPVAEAVMLWGLDQSSIENAENLTATPPPPPSS